ncbi:hypothetical protein Plec18167_004524 [Paecilomyces lecythidis]|uniref:Uncharacterized protein n=1 Tax=Paecilomyces lecythidis TaxID=3004212 RepID=A0ABR3XS86_9EURO
MHNIMNARAIIHHSYYWLERKARRVSRASHPPEEISQDAQIEKVCRDKQQFHNVVDFFGLRPGSYKLHTQWALDEEDTYEIPNILDNFGRYTVRILNWATSKQEIFTYITHIVEDAIYRMQIDPDSDSEEDETASEIARCYITDAEWDDKFDHLHARN